MSNGRLITLDGQVYEVVAEAPGGTSMLLVNRSLKAKNRVEELERLLCAARMDLARVDTRRGMACPPG